MNDVWPRGHALATCALGLTRMPCQRQLQELVEGQRLLARAHQGLDRAEYGRLWERAVVLYRTRPWLTDFPQAVRAALTERGNGAMAL